jgi:hypothetical protein
MADKHRRDCDGRLGEVCGHRFIPYLIGHSLGGLPNAGGEQLGKSASFFPVRSTAWFGGVLVGRRPIAEASDPVLARCARSGCTGPCVESPPRAAPTPPPCPVQLDKQEGEVVCLKKDSDTVGQSPNAEICVLTCLR